MAYEDWVVGTATINGCDWEPPPPSLTPSSLFVGHFTVVFSYVVDGKQYSGKFCSAYEWEKEKEIQILYNPQDPVESGVCDEDESKIIPALECVLVLLDGL